MTSQSLLSRRPATDEDADFARQVHHEAYRGVVQRQFGSWDEELQDGFFESVWQDAAFEVLQWDGAPCGYVAVEEGPEALKLRELVVAPSHQGKGIGTQVVESVLELAAERRLPVVLEALHENRAAVLYRRLGFVETGRSSTHTQFRRPAHGG